MNEAYERIQALKRAVRDEFPDSYDVQVNPLKDSSWNEFAVRVLSLVSVREVLTTALVEQTAHPQALAEDVALGLRHELARALENEADRLRSRT